jgi:hypothetical protein
MLEAPSVVKSEGRKLWASLQDFNRYWPEFRSYVRQAKAYDDAAAYLSGASAALLSYYCALNLAKAELLRVSPEQVYRKRVGHGLSYNPARSQSLKGEVVTTQESGVFRLLYKARAGVDVPSKINLSAVALIDVTADVAAESAAVSLGEGRSCAVSFAICWDADLMWFNFGMHADCQPLLNCKATQRFLASHFTKIPGTSLAGMSLAPKQLPINQILQSRFSLQKSNPGDEKFATATDVNAVLKVAQDTMQSIQSVGGYGYDQWAMSLLRSKWLPMRPDLARYAAMFYCSSVARYRPSMIFGDDDGLATWILGAFVDEARIHLLRDAVRGVTGRYVELVPPASGN